MRKIRASPNRLLTLYNIGNMKSIVLTGVSGGMGLATAKKLLENGYHVFGLDIKEPAFKHEELTFVQADLRDASSIEKAYAIVKGKAEELDAIISMAGIYDLNSLIEMSEEDFIRIFDINVFSVYRLNKAFVPLLKEKGKVIIISSELAPLDPLPFTGIYGITKSTVEKYAYSLRMELQLLNKQVVVVRPGAVKTSLLDVSGDRIDHFTKNTKTYQTNARKFKEITESIKNRNIDASKIADLIYKILNKKKPRYVYSINRNPLLLLLNAMPQRFQNWVIKKILLSKEK